MSLYSLDIQTPDFITKIIVSSEQRELDDAKAEVLEWAKGFYPAGTNLQVKWISHETKIDLHYFVSGGYSAIKIL